MIEAKKRKKTAPERGQQSFSLMMKRQIQIVFSMFHTKARNPNCSVSLSILCKASRELNDYYQAQKTEMTKGKKE